MIGSPGQIRTCKKKAAEEGTMYVLDEMANPDGTVSPTALCVYCICPLPTATQPSTERGGWIRIGA